MMIADRQSCARSTKALCGSKGVPAGAARHFKSVLSTLLRPRVLASRNDRNGAAAADSLCRTLKLRNTEGRHRMAETLYGSGRCVPSARPQYGFCTQHQAMNI
jgi:hypothetical protein